MQTRKSPEPLHPCYTRVRVGLVSDGVLQWLERRISYWHDILPAFHLITFRWQHTSPGQPSPSHIAASSLRRTHQSINTVLEKA